MNDGTPGNKVESINIFLLNACEVAAGDIEKRLHPVDIIKRVDRVSINTDNISEILDKLKELQFIELFNDQEFAVTYHGIYYIAKVMGRSPESLGILSENDMRFMIYRFNHWVYEESLKTDNKISLEMIVREFSSVIGDKPIKQLINTLLKRGVLMRKDSYYELVK